jgi:hypothetical protein
MKPKDTSSLREVGRREPHHQCSRVRTADDETTKARPGCKRCVVMNRVLITRCQCKRGNLLRIKRVLAGKAMPDREGFL